MNSKPGVQVADIAGKLLTAGSVSAFLMWAINPANYEKYGAVVGFLHLLFLLAVVLGVRSGVTRGKTRVNTLDLVGLAHLLGTYFACTKAELASLHAWDQFLLGWAKGVLYPVLSVSVLIWLVVAMRMLSKHIPGRTLQTPAPA